MRRGDRYQLRRALLDACQQCSACGGAGLRFIAGGSIKCGRCGWWRAVLKQTGATRGLWPRLREVIGL